MLKWNEILLGMLIGFAIVQNFLHLFSTFMQLGIDVAGLYTLWIFIDLKQTS